jgi:DNA-binding GntR family transcriptional regulator
MRLPGSGVSGFRGSEGGLLEPIVRPDLVDDVYHRIRHAIFAGTLAPGERLVEDLLAAQLGVSRAPIRDALKQLERDGLIASAGKRGKVVSLLTARDAWEVYSLRSTLEAMAISLAIRSATPELFAELDGLVAEMAPASVAGDHERLSALDVQFHGAICRASGHDRLLRAWESMSIQIRLLSQQVIETIYADLQTIPERHAAVVARMRAGDEAQAEAAIRVHIDSVSERVMRVLQGAEDRLAASGDPAPSDPELIDISRGEPAR